MKHFILILACLIAVSPASAESSGADWKPAAKVIGVDKRKDVIRISQDESRRWKVDDKVCVKKNKKEIACGAVIFSTLTEATVRLGSVIQIKDPAKKTNETQLAPNKKPKARQGDLVFRESQLLTTTENLSDKPPAPSTETVGSAPWDVIPASPSEVPTPPPPPPRRERFLTSTPAAEPSSAPVPTPMAATTQAGTSKEREPARTSWQAGAGLVAGIGYHFPSLDFQFAMHRSLSVSLMPLFFTGAVENFRERVFGGFLSFELYLSRPAFTGFFLRGGGGAYSLDVESSRLKQSGTVPAAMLLLGFRELLSPSFSVSLSAGAQYIGESKSVTLLRFSGAMPVVLVGVGYVL